MLDTRNVAIDTIFVILYIGLSAAMVCLSVTLAIFAALGFEFTPAHALALAVNGFGWLAVLMAPSLYRKALGMQFRWRQNVALGDIA